MKILRKWNLKGCCIFSYYDFRSFQYWFFYFSNKIKQAYSWKLSLVKDFFIILSDDGILFLDRIWWRFRRRGKESDEKVGLIGFLVLVTDLKNATSLIRSSIILIHNSLAYFKVELWRINFHSFSVIFASYLLFFFLIWLI